MIINKSNISKIIFIVFSMFLIFFTFQNSSFISASAASEQEAIETYNRLAKQQKEIIKNITALKKQKDNQTTLKIQLDRKIDVTQQQITLLNQRIVNLNSQISAKEVEITQNQKVIDDNYEVFKKRIRAMYMTSDISLLQALIGAEDFSIFLTRAEVLKRVAKHDRDLIEDLTKKKNAVEAAKADIVANKTELETAKKDQNTKQTQLTEDYNEVNGMLATTNKDQVALQEKYNKNKKEMEAANADVLRYRSNGVYIGGDFIWPVAGFSRLTSLFGPRNFAADPNHTGIDIAGSGIFGAPALASNSGTVIYAAQKGGYGIHVLVDHGGGYITLYGHLSSLSVSVGQKVSKGQKVGAIGSTGLSTGPHLHFGIMVNGKFVNPLIHVKY